MNKDVRLVYTRDEMVEMNVNALASRGVKIEDIAEIAKRQQGKYNPNVSLELCVESVMRILSYRDVFHIVQLGIEMDKLAEQHKFSGPIQDIIYYDLGLFGTDETLGLEIARNYGTIGQTNFGDIDVNKFGIVNKLNEDGKKDGVCHTFLDDIVGALAASASTRVAQIGSENSALDGSASRIGLSLFKEKKNNK